MLKESAETQTRMRCGIFGSSQEQKEANLPILAIRARAACFVFLHKHLGNENQKWWEENVGGNSLCDKKDYYCFFQHLTTYTIFISSYSPPFILSSLYSVVRTTISLFWVSPFLCNSAPLVKLHKCQKQVLSPEVSEMYAKSGSSWRDSAQLFVNPF